MIELQVCVIKLWETVPDLARQTFPPVPPNQLQRAFAPRQSCFANDSQSNCIGLLVGEAEGGDVGLADVGCCDGELEGGFEGPLVGAADGDNEGLLVVGWKVGVLDGEDDGSIVGETLGDVVGLAVQQMVPSPLQPSGHVQLKLPSVSLHVALSSQLWPWLWLLPFSHSLMLVHTNPLPIS